MVNGHCVHLVELLAAERPALEREFEKNKYYLSQKAHFDVGLKTAKDDFLEHYLTTWAAGFKAAYCHHVCPGRENCGVK